MNAPAKGPLPTLATKAAPELLDEMTLRIDVARAFVDDVEDENARKALASLCGAYEVMVSLLKASRRFERG